MPRVPFLNSHGKSIDIFVKQLEQTNGLNDGLILSVNIKGDFVSGEEMGQTQPRLFQFYVLEFFMLQEIQEVLSDSTGQLINHCWSCGLDLKGLVNRTSQLIIAHS